MPTGVPGVGRNGGACNTRERRYAKAIQPEPSQRHRSHMVHQSGSGAFSAPLAFVVRNRPVRRLGESLAG